jgi:hypothetical protein
MSTTFPRRRMHAGDAVNPQDWNGQLDPFYTALTSLNEHNLSSGFRTQVQRQIDMADDIAWRLASAVAEASLSSAGINEVIGGAPDLAPGALVFQSTETWLPIWTFSWTSSERSDIYAAANVQAQHAIDRGSWVASDAGLGPGGTDQFYRFDNINLKLGWILDGSVPSEHVRGALDTGAAGLNMERGFGGEFNAQDVTALFKSVGPGDHTIQLCVMRTYPNDEVVGIPERKCTVPLWEAEVWEISR